MKDAERYVSRIVQNHIGEAGIVFDESQTNGLDFRIDYRDGRRAVGEITSHPDSKHLSLIAEVIKCSPTQMVELPSGSGVWAVRLTPDSIVKKIFRELPGLIDAMVRFGIIHWGGHYANWNSSELSTESPLDEQLAALKIFEILRYPDLDGDWARLTFPTPRGGIGGVESVVDWIEFILSEEKYSDNAKKLLRVEDVDERHLVLIAGDASPVTMDGPEGWDMPKRNPLAPDGISHIWAVSRYTERHSLVWACDSGWHLVQAIPYSAS